MSAAAFGLVMRTVCLVVAVWTAAVVHAQTTFTWDGGGGDNLWSNGTNWIGDTAPTRNSSTFLNFAGTTRTSPVNNAADWQQIAGMTFASGASGFRIEGNPIGFANANGEQVINQNAVTTQEINAVFSFGATQDSRINLNAGDLLLTAPNMYIDSAQPAFRSLTIAGTDATRRTVTVAGNLNKSYDNNDPDLFISNNKRVLVTGSLTFGTGNDTSVFIHDGVLQFSGAGGMTGGRVAVGDTSGTASASLWLDTAGSTFGQQLNVRNGSSGRRIVGGLNTSGTVTFSSEFVLGDTSLDLAAATGGTANFTGARNLNASLFVNRSDPTAYGGTVILSNTTSSNSHTALEGGTLQFSDFNQLGTSHFEFNAGSGDSGTLRYTGGSTTTTKTLWIDNTGITRAAIDVTQAGTTLTWNPGDGNVNQNLTKVGGGTLNFGTNRITGSATVGVAAGTLIVTGSNSYSGGTMVTGGTLQVAASGTSFGGSAAGLGTGTVSIAVGGQVSYWLSDGNPRTVANPFSLSGGTLFTTDGSNTYSGQVTLASGSSTIASQYEDTITLSGGRVGAGNLLFTQTGNSGGSAAPTFVLSGTGANTGTVRVSGSSGGGFTKLQLANVNALQAATLDLATGDVGTVEFTAAGTNTYALGGLQGTRNLAIGVQSLTVGGNGQSTAFSGNLSGSGALTKLGAGNLQLSGANTFTGLTSVSAGGLRLNGSIAGSLSVASIASLSGTGTVGGNATVTGTHSPGNSPGVQTFNGNLTYLAGAVVNWELIANTSGSAGVNYDQVVIPTGNLTFSGSTTLALSFNGAGSTVNWSDAFWNVNRAWIVYDLSGGTTTSLSNLALGGSLLDSQSVALVPSTRGYFETSLAGQDVLLSFVAVPEPSTYILLAAGGGLIAALRTRRRRQ